MHVTRERLLPVVDDLHGAVRVQRQQCTVDLHREVLPATECAADTAEMDANRCQRQREARRDLRTVDVQPLSGDVDVDAAFSIGNREPRLGPEERLILAPDLVHAGHRHLALGVGIAVADHHVAHDVRPVVLAVAVPPRRLLRMEVRHLRGARHVVDRLERLVVDADARSRAPRLLGMLSRDERDRLPVVEDAVDREHGLVGELEAVVLLTRDVRVRQDSVNTWH